MSSDAFGQLVHTVLELCFGNETVHKTQFVRPFRSHSFAGQHNFQSTLRPDKERKDGRRQRRENADGNFWLSKSRPGRGNHEVAKGGQLRAASDGGAIHHTDDGLAYFKHPGKGAVKRVEHLKYALGSVFSDVDAVEDCLACAIEDD